MVYFDARAVKTVTGWTKDQACRWIRQGYVRPTMLKNKRGNLQRFYSIHDVVEIWLICEWARHHVHLPTVIDTWLPAFRRLLSRTVGLVYRGMVLTKWWKADNGNGRTGPDMTSPMAMGTSRPPYRPGGRWIGGGTPAVVEKAHGRRRWGRWTTVHVDPLIKRIEEYCDIADLDLALPGKRAALLKVLREGGHLEAAA